jgi:two-component system cell cycle sensor histidine kinase/response regulator CckA
VSGKLTYRELEEKVKELENEAFELKRAEKMLLETDKRYRELQEECNRAKQVYKSLVHYSADAIIIYDMEGKARYVSPAFTRIFGWTPEEVQGGPIPFFPDSQQDDTINLIEDLIENGTLCQGLKTKRCTKTGNVLDIMASACRYDDHEGKPAGIMVVLRDITQTEKLQAQLQHAQKMETVGTIASGVAHNFRNILAGISINSQLIEMKYPNDSTLVHIAEKIIRAVERGAKLVDGLMHFSRKERKKQFKRLDVAQILYETHDLICKCFAKNIDISINVPELPSVIGDHSGLSQVFMNLCVNARDSMPNGGRLLINAEQKGNEVEICFSDTGQGMDKETQEQCIDPFFTTKDGHSGTGLGLSVSHGIVKEHGGHIRVYSELNAGTTFRISLPIAIDGKRNVQEEFLRVIRGLGQKILVVDDETEFLQPMVEMLEGLGYRTAAAQSGEEAIEMYRAFQPDLVLMDRNMAGMDGLSCGKEIIENDPDAKIVIMSGYDPICPQAIDTPSWEWTKDYFTKPVDMIELSHVLGRVIG